MSVYYKFKSNTGSDKVTFDGVHISVGDLKKAILQQKKFGKSNDFDLLITNAQNNEVYSSDDTLIQKNTTVLVARVPLANAPKRNWNVETNENSAPMDGPLLGIPLDKLIKNSDLSKSDASEEEKIKKMMTQSTQEYDASKFVRGRSTMTGPVPPNYLCHRCNQTGHYIKNCPTNPADAVKRSTGIPRSFMMPAKADQKGALLTPSGEYVVPIIDHQAYKQVKKEKPPFVPTESEPELKEPEIPEELQCPKCNGLLQDAVMIPCCGNSFCDECIRTKLLESDEHECPSCNSVNISPDSLLPNRYLRNAVSRFKGNSNDSASAVKSNTNISQSKSQGQPVLNNKMVFNFKQPILPSSDESSSSNNTTTTTTTINTAINTTTTTAVATDAITTTIIKKDVEQSIDLNSTLVSTESLVEKEATLPTSQPPSEKEKEPDSEKELIQDKVAESENGLPTCANELKENLGQSDHSNVSPSQDQPSESVDSSHQQPETKDSVNEKDSSHHRLDEYEQMNSHHHGDIMQTDNGSHRSPYPDQNFHYDPMNSDYRDNRRPFSSRPNNGRRSYDRELSREYDHHQHNRHQNEFNLQFGHNNMPYNGGNVSSGRGIGSNNYCDFSNMNSRGPINRSDQRQSILGPPPRNFSSNNLNSNQQQQFNSGAGSGGGGNFNNVGGNFGVGNYANNYGPRDHSGSRDMRGGRGSRYNQSVGIHSGNNGRGNNQLGPNNFNDTGAHYDNRYMTGSRGDYNGANNVGMNRPHPGEMGYASLHSNHFAPTFATDAPLNVEDALDKFNKQLEEKARKDPHRVASRSRSRHRRSRSSSSGSSYSRSSSYSSSSDSSSSDTSRSRSRSHRSHSRKRTNRDVGSKRRSYSRSRRSKNQDYRSSAITTTTTSKDRHHHRVSKRSKSRTPVRSPHSRSRTSNRRNDSSAAHQSSSSSRYSPTAALSKAAASMAAEAASKSAARSYSSDRKIVIPENYPDFKSSTHRSGHHHHPHHHHPHHHQQQQQQQQQPHRSSSRNRHESKEPRTSSRRNRVSDSLRTSLKEEHPAVAVPTVEHEKVSSSQPNQIDLLTPSTNFSVSTINLAPTNISDLAIETKIENKPDIVEKVGHQDTLIPAAPVKNGKESDFSLAIQDDDAKEFDELEEKYEKQAQQITQAFLNDEPLTVASKEKDSLLAVKEGEKSLSQSTLQIAEPRAGHKQNDHHQMEESRKEKDVHRSRDKDKRKDKERGKDRGDKDKSTKESRHKDRPRSSERSHDKEARGHDRDKSRKHRPRSDKRRSSHGKENKEENLDNQRDSSSSSIEHRSSLKSKSSKRRHSLRDEKSRKERHEDKSEDDNLNHSKEKRTRRPESGEDHHLPRSSGDIKQDSGLSSKGKEVFEHSQQHGGDHQPDPSSLKEKRESREKGKKSHKKDKRKDKEERQDRKRKHDLDDKEMKKSKKHKKHKDKGNDEESKSKSRKKSKRPAKDDHHNDSHDRARERKSSKV